MIITYEQQFTFMKITKANSKLYKNQQNYCHISLDLLKFIYLILEIITLIMFKMIRI